MTCIKTYFYKMEEKKNDYNNIIINSYSLIKRTKKGDQRFLRAKQSKLNANFDLAHENQKL